MIFGRLKLCPSRPPELEGEGEIKLASFTSEAPKRVKRKNRRWIINKGKS
jgi:hypothetical protein